MKKILYAKIKTAEFFKKCKLCAEADGRERHGVSLREHEVWKTDGYGISFCGQNVFVKNV